MIDWIFRFVKGMFIGTGAILPGVSGGALAAVFGIYERMIGFIANITKNFKENFLFFLPVGIGGVTGIFLLSFVLSFFLKTAETQLCWFFVGCIGGVFPSLYKEAGKKGRTKAHLIEMFIVLIFALLFLFQADNIIKGALPLNFGTWMMAGAIFGLGMIVPGLSPSNFLVYLNMYEPMTDGIKNLDISVIIPVLIGAGVLIVALSKIVNYLFQKAYSGFFHFILGVVIASTVMIIPRGVSVNPMIVITCALACVIGVGLGLWMSHLEDKYKKVEE